MSQQVVIALVLSFRQWNIHQIDLSHDHITHFMACAWAEQQQRQQPNFDVRRKREWEKWIPVKWTGFCWFVFLLSSVAPYWYYREQIYWFNSNNLMVKYVDMAHMQFETLIIRARMRTKEKTLIRDTVPRGQRNISEEKNELAYASAQRCMWTSRQ